MTVPPKADPRANQKQRTRTAIIDGALEILHEGAMPTVAAAAERAKVSRATAYRYFATQDDLGEELSRIHPSIATVDRAVANLSTDDVEQRLAQLLATYNPIVLSTEAQMRSMLKMFQEMWLQARPDRTGSKPYLRSHSRTHWLEEVLRPVDRLSADRRKRLIAGLALTLGIESIVTLKDVCHLDDDEALAVLQWVATILLRAGLEDDPPHA